MSEGKFLNYLHSSASRAEMRFIASVIYYNNDGSANTLLKITSCHHLSNKYLKT